MKERTSGRSSKARIEEGLSKFHCCSDKMLWGHLQLDLKRYGFSPPRLIFSAHRDDSFKLYYPRY